MALCEFPFCYLQSESTRGACAEHDLLITETTAGIARLRAQGFEPLGFRLDGQDLERFLIAAVIPFTRFDHKPYVWRPNQYNADDAGFGTRGVWAKSLDAIWAPQWVAVALNHWGDSPPPQIPLSRYYALLNHLTGHPEQRDAAIALFSMQVPFPNIAAALGVPAAPEVPHEEEAPHRNRSLPVQPSATLPPAQAPDGAPTATKAPVRRHLLACHRGRLRR